MWEEVSPVSIKLKSNNQSVRDQFRYEKLHDRIVVLPCTDGNDGPTGPYGPD